MSSLAFSFLTPLTVQSTRSSALLAPLRAPARRLPVPFPRATRAPTASLGDAPPAPEESSEPAAPVADEASPSQGPREPLFLLGSAREYLEFWFSPANLRRDWYLRYHMDKDGFAPIVLFTAFNRLVLLGATIQDIVDAVEESEKIEFSPDMKSIRPVGGLATMLDGLEDEKMRTVIVTGVPKGSKTTIDYLLPLFLRVGVVKYLTRPRTRDEIKNGIVYVEFEAPELAAACVANWKESIPEFLEEGMNVDIEVWADHTGSSGMPGLKKPRLVEITGLSSQDVTWSGLWAELNSDGRAIKYLRYINGEDKAYVLYRSPVCAQQVVDEINGTTIKDHDLHAGGGSHHWAETVVGADAETESEPESAPEPATPLEAPAIGEQATETGEKVPKGFIKRMLAGCSDLHARVCSAKEQIEVLEVSRAKVARPPTFVEGTVVMIYGLRDEHNWKVIRKRVADQCEDKARFIRYTDGEPYVYVTFQRPEYAEEFYDSLAHEGAKFLGDSITVKILEGSEEEDYWKAAKENRRGGNKSSASAPAVESEAVDPVAV